MDHLLSMEKNLIELITKRDSSYQNIFKRFT